MTFTWKPPASGRAGPGAVARWTGLAVAGLVLSSCGFTPLYGTGGVNPSLSRIDVEPPKGRTGYLVGEQLNDQFARDRGRPARYRLVIGIRQTRFARGVRVNAVANRYEIVLNVAYSLTEAGTGRQLTSGSLPFSVSYDSADPPYAGVAAEQDAEQRAAYQAAVLLRLELSRYFAGLPGR